MDDVLTQQEDGSQVFHAQPWDDVKDKFTKSFPDLDPKMMEDRYNSARRLAMERQRLAQADTSGGTATEDTITAAIPFGGPIAKAVKETAYQESRQRILEGASRPGDEAMVAYYEKQQADRANRSGLTNVGLGALGGARFAGETMMGGGIARGAGLGAKAAGWAGLGAASVPGAIEHAAMRASGKDDNSRFYSPENAIPAAAMSAAQALVFGAAGKWAQGFTKPVARVAAEIGGGVGANQAVDLAAGVADEFLQKQWKTDTGYGLLGKVIRGQNGEALQQAATETVTMALLSLMHAGNHEQATKALDEFNSTLKEQAKAGATPDQAAQAIREKLQPKPAPVQTPEQAPQPAPQPVPQPQYAAHVSDADLIGFAKGLGMEASDKASKRGDFTRADAEKYLKSNHVHEDLIEVTPAKPQVIQPDLRPPEQATGQTIDLESRLVDRDAKNLRNYSNERADQLVSELKSHQDSGGTITLHSPDLSKPVSLHVEGDKIKDSEGKPWGMMGMLQIKGKIELGQKAAPQATTLPDGSIIQPSGEEGYFHIVKNGRVEGSIVADSPEEAAAKWQRLRSMKPIPQEPVGPKDLGFLQGMVKPSESPTVEPPLPEPKRGMSAKAQEVWDQLPPGTPEEKLKHTFDLVGISEKQQRILYERALKDAPTHQQIGEAMGLKGKGVRANIEKAEKDAWKKIERRLGTEATSTFREIIQRAAEDHQQELRAANEASPESKDVLDFVNGQGGARSSESHTPKEQLIYDWADYLKRNENAIVSLTPEQRAAHSKGVAQAIDAGLPPPAKGLFGGAQPSAEGGIGNEASIRRGVGGSLQPRTPPGPEVEAPQVEGSQGERASANAGNAEAAGNELSGISERVDAAGPEHSLEDVIAALDHDAHLHELMGRPLPDEQVTQAASKILTPALEQASAGKPTAEDIGYVSETASKLAKGELAAETGIAPDELQQRLDAAERPQQPGGNGLGGNAEQAPGTTAPGGGGFGRPVTAEERSVLPGGGQPNAEGAQRPKKLTALANEQVDRERVAAGKPPLMSAARQSNPESWDKAMDRLEKDPEAGAKLVEELLKKPRATTVEENALLLHRKIATSNELERAAIDTIKAMKGGDVLDIAEAEGRYDKLMKASDDIDKVARETGTEWGRAGQFRRQLAAEDYSLGGMLMKAQAAKGKPLTAEERQQIIDLSQKIKDLQQKLSEAEAALKKAQENGGGKPGSKEQIEWTRIKVAVNKATGGFQDSLKGYKDANKPIGQKVEDWLVKIRRAFVISSPTTMVKIAAASAERLGIAPIEEAVGGALSKLPGLVKIAQAAPREGGFNTAIEKKAFASSWGQGLIDAWDTLKTGKSELDILYGKDYGPRSLWDLPGELHAAAKAPAVRAEYTRSFLKRVDQAIATGQDATSPAAMIRFGTEAYKDSQRAKFQQDNRVVQAYQRAIDTLKAKDASAGSRAIGTAAQLALPVVKIPTNLVAETLQYATGSVTGSVRLGLALRKGVENLKPEEADVIMRSLKKGSLGLAVLALGYANPQMIGGFYSGKRDEKDVEAGGIKTPAGTIPSWALHNPLLEVLQMGATIRRASDKLYKGGRQGESEGVVAGMAGLAEEVPFMREAKDLGSMVSTNARERGYAFGQFAKSLAVPQLVQWLAGQTDKQNGQPIKRKPVTTFQHIETGIPGLRQRVPAK